MVLLTKVTLDNYLEQNQIYSKNIRGNLPFTGEVHILNGGKNICIRLYRCNPQIETFLKAAEVKGMLTHQTFEASLDSSVLRMTLNDEKFMINGAGKTSIIIEESNFYSKDVQIKDFPQGKVEIVINITFENEVDNSKVKKELKDFLTEDNND